MLPIFSDIEAYQGDSFERRISLWADADLQTPFNAQHYVARMQIRRGNARGPLLLELSTTSGLEFLQQTPPDGPYNLVEIRITPAQAATLPVGEHAYDIEITNDVNFRRTIYAGVFRVTQEVTR